MSIPTQHSESSTSASLIRRVQNNDRDAWEQFSVVYGPLIYDWARRHGLQSQDASDVMQDVLQALTQAVNTFDPNRGTPFRGWLWTVTRNKVNDLWRSEQQRVAAEGGTAALQRINQMADEPPSPDAESSRADLSGIQQRALDVMQTNFEHQTWQAFWRTVINRETPADVATEMGISTWTVYKARSRVLKRLRDEFGELL